jgi:COMPASS component SWD3
MHEGLKELPGHGNRIFAIKYDPKDPNVIVSGGWDKTLQVYDIRTNGPVASIYGPLISGDSLDICDGLILAGS